MGRDEVLKLLRELQEALVSLFIVLSSLYYWNLCKNWLSPRPFRENANVEKDWNNKISMQIRKPNISIFFT